MKFDKALRKMKTGVPMKLPTWGGFWSWDEENQTIMMHCVKKDKYTGKYVIDIRETKRVEYTILNICSDEWIEATKENCILMSIHCTFDFGDAVKYMKSGFKVKRQGWNGKEQYIELARNISYENSNGDIVNSNHDAIGNMAIAFVGTSGVQMGWLASQADMLAEDWVLVE